MAGGSLNGVMTGHHYNRAIHAYKVVYETLEELRFQEYLESIDETKYENVISILTTVEESAQKIQLEYDDWIKKRRAENSAFEFFSFLMDMVSLLLVLIRATRTSDTAFTWQLWNI